MSRESNFMIEEALRKGLRPTTRTPRNSEFLTTCDNLLARPEGLHAYDDITQAISGAELTANTVTVAFPFPQIFKGRGKTWLLDDDAIFEVNESTWALTPITTYDYYTPASTKAITAGGPWHVADFWDHYLFFNGTDTIIKFGDDAKYYIEDTVGATTGCAHRGVLVMGGFDSSSFWSSSWKTYLQSLIVSENPPNSQIDATLLDVHKNWIWWSSIGGGDVEFIFNLTQAQSGPWSPQPTGDYSSANPLVEEYWCRNEWGLMPMTFQGEVLRVEELGQHLVVYGEDGINILTAHSSPIPTYGLTRELSIGIDSRSSVSSNGSRHLFVDDGGDLWQITADLQISRLDYNEYLSPMIGGEIVITENLHQGWASICDDTVAYALVDGGGLSKIPEQITSQFFTQGGQVGISETYGTDQPLVVTDTFDMKDRAIKEVVGIEVGGVPDTEISVALDFRYDAQTSFSRTPFYPVNFKGVATFMVAAVEFRVVIKPTIASGGVVDLDYIRVKYRVSDRTAIRGPHGGN